MTTPKDPIERIESWARLEIGFVRVTARSGAQGWGQLSTYHADLSAEVLHRYVTQNYLGRDADRPEELVEDCLRFECKMYGTFTMRALAGIDTALWDLRGKKAGLPVCALLGGRPGSLPAYASSMRRDTTPGQEVDRFRRWADEHGASAFKYKIMHPKRKNIDAAPGRSRALIRAMGAAFPGAVLIADANGGYLPETAIEDSYLMKDCGVAYLEEPCFYLDQDANAAVSAASAVPVVGGEQDFDELRWRRLLRKKVYRFAQFDPCYVGGFSRLLRLSRLAGEHGTSVMPHTSNPSMVMLFAMHLLRVLPNAGPMVEYGIEEDPWLDGLLDPPLAMENGHVAMPEGPGWGVDVDEGWLKGAVYRKDEL